MVNRKLDSYYFRVNRNDKWENICFSDLTEKEMDSILIGRDAMWLIDLCKGLGKTIREIGDSLDIAKE